jgi:hypothetical protein
LRGGGTKRWRKEKSGELLNEGKGEKYRLPVVKTPGSLDSPLVNISGEL